MGFFQPRHLLYQALGQPDGTVVFVLPFKQRDGLRERALASLLPLLPFAVQPRLKLRIIVQGETLKEIAAEHQVPMVEDKPLAQALYKLVELGDYIPAELYRAVAEVLAYVYRLKGMYRKE